MAYVATFVTYKAKRFPILFVGMAVRKFNMSIADRYNEIIELRLEALRKYNARHVSDVCAPPFRISIPTFGLRPPDMPFRKVGPIYFAANPPILKVIEQYVRMSLRAVSILEIGPGPGTIAGYLRHRYTERIERYIALERDQSVNGPYERAASPEEVPAGIDLVIASEVAEHMTADAFFEGIIAAVLPKLTPDAIMILGTPNALSPGAIFRDVTHVQGYPWYDLYALTRLWFDTADIFRMHYAYSENHLLVLIPRVVLTKLLELDWCENLVCIGRHPNRTDYPI